MFENLREIGKFFKIYFLSLLKLKKKNQSTKHFLIISSKLKLALPYRRKQSQILIKQMLQKIKDIL